MSLSGILLAGGKSRRLGINKLQIKSGPVPLLIDQIFKMSFFCDEIIISTSLKNYALINRECQKIGKYLRHFIEIKKINTLEGMDFRSKGETFLKVPEIKIVIDDLNEIGTDSIYPDRDNKEPPGETGPIAGIYTGLKNASNYYSFILAFDMPLISFRMIGILVDILKQDLDCHKKRSASGKTSNTYDVFIIKTQKGFEVLSGIYSKTCINALKKNIVNKNNRISDIFKYIKVRIIEEEFLRSENLDMLNFFNINKIEDYKKFKEIWSSELLKSEQFYKFHGAFFKRWAEFFFR